MKKCMALLLILLLLLSGCTQPQPEETLPSQTAGTQEPQESLGDCTHADSDDNGICDLCAVSVMTTFDFYCVNDLHGKLADGENHPGVDELTTYLSNAQQTDDHVIILSAGDMWQGSSESNLTYGAIMTDWMNEVGFAAMTIGNHEFDWGTANIAENAEAADFPYLAINIYDRATDTLVDYCQASVVVEADGVQIGIIGAIGDCYYSISSDKVADVYFKTGAELTELVKAESQRLRAEGVDFVVYMLHDGLEQSYGTDITGTTGSQLQSYYDISLSDGYVDLVFEAHTHQQYLLLDTYGVYHMQNKGENKGGISHVEISVNTVTGTSRVGAGELILTTQYDQLESDPIVDTLLEKYADVIAPANAVVGVTESAWGSSQLKQLVADLYYQLGLETWGDSYDIVLGGGFISVRSPYTLEAGEVIYSQLQSLLPFDNDIVLCSVLGRDLLEKFIETDNRNYFICGDETAMSGIDPDGVYYIVVDTYTASYSPNRLTVVEEYETGIYARDLVADYIAAGGME